MVDRNSQEIRQVLMQSRMTHSRSVGTQTEVIRILDGLKLQETDR